MMMYGMKQKVQTAHARLSKLAHKHEDNLARCFELGCCWLCIFVKYQSDTKSFNSLNQCFVFVSTLSTIFSYTDADDCFATLS